MKTKILNGYHIANNIINKISCKLKNILESGKYFNLPSAAVILVGDDFSSNIYVKNKINQAKKLGYCIYFYKFNYSITEYKLLKLIYSLNINDNIHGILLQLPLPNHINIKNVVSKIIPNKDIDCLNPCNIGKLYLKNSVFRSCTSYGIITLLKKYKIKLKNLHAVIVGTSNIVGKPMSIELINEGCVVTILNKYNNNIKYYVKQADLLIVAVGIPKFILGEWVKNNSILIDVGINRYNDKKIIGDIDIYGALDKASYITPVPGGIGPMTIAILLKNILNAFIINSKI